MARGIGYVFAVGCDFQLTTCGQVKVRADQALGLVEARGWTRRSCGNGSKGRRLFDWARIAPTSPRHQLLIRRKISYPTEPAYYIAFTPAHYVCSLTDLIKVAGTRWAIEDGFQDAKQSVGPHPDPDARLPGLEAAHRPRPGRLRTVGHRIRTGQSNPPRTRPARRPRPALPTELGMIALTVPEIQRLLRLILPARANTEPEVKFHPSWSEWRRRPRARARRHHHRRRRRYTLTA